MSTFRTRPLLVARKSMIGFFPASLALKKLRHVGV